MADLGKVDPLSTTSRIGHAAKPDPVTGQGDVTPSTFLLRQWQLIRSFVNGAAQNLAALIAAVARIDATTVTGTTPLAGGGAIGAGNIAITHDESGVTPGTYGDSTNVPQITVDEFGHVTSIADVPISGGGGGQWTLVDSHDFTATPQATWDVNNLGSYDEWLVILVGITRSSNSIVRVRFSTDNGASFFNTAGDYFDLGWNIAAGTSNSQDGLALWSTANTAAVYANMIVVNPSVNGSPKVANGPLRQGVFVASLSPIDAIRLTTGTAATMNGGSIYVLGR